MTYCHTVAGQRHTFTDLRELLARASPLRSGDRLAGVAAHSATERMAAQMALADLPLRTFLHEAVVPYETDAVTRLILDTHDTAAFEAVAHLTVGDFRNWLLSNDTVLTGRYTPTHAEVDLASVMREIDDARDEDAARRLRMAQ